MATTNITNVPGGAGETHKVEITSLTATSVNDILTAGAATVYGVEVDCGQNQGEDVAFRMYNAASPTVGTTDAYCVVKGYKGKKKEYKFPDGIAFGTSLSVAATQEMGGTGGSTDPSGKVNVTMLVKDS